MKDLQMKIGRKQKENRKKKKENRRKKERKQKENRKKKERKQKEKRKKIERKIDRLFKHRQMIGILIDNRGIDRCQSQINR